MRFLRGLGKLYPPVQHPAPVWDLSLVPKCRIRPPFKPLTTYSLLHMSMKTAFLIAITSSRWVVEIGTLMAYPLSWCFLNTVTLWPYPKYLPKVSSKFLLIQPIHLPVFHHKLHPNCQEAQLHTLDVRRALAFYLVDKTKSFRKIHKLFLSLADRLKGSAVSNQKLSK